MFYQMYKFYLAMAPHGPVFSRYFPLPFHRHFELVFCHDVIVQIKSRDFTVGRTTVSGKSVEHFNINFQNNEEILVGVVMTS